MDVSFDEKSQENFCITLPGHRNCGHVRKPTPTISSTTMTSICLPEAGATWPTTAPESAGLQATALASATEFAQ